MIRICLPKKITTFFSLPLEITSPFFTTQKNPGVLHRPKKITFGQIFRPKKVTWTHPSPRIIKLCEWGPWAVNISNYVFKSNHLHFLLKKILTNSVNGRGD